MLQARVVIEHYIKGIREICLDRRLKVNKVLGSVRGDFTRHSSWMKRHGTRVISEILRFSPFKHHSIIVLYPKICISYVLNNLHLFLS
jgi:hypothetical protein